MTAKPEARPTANGQRDDAADAKCNLAIKPRSKVHAAVRAWYPVKLP